MREILLHVLYSLEIGRFLEADFLSQGCEDVLVDNLSLYSQSQVLRWVVGIAARVAMGPPSSAAPPPLRVQYFSAIAQAPVLLELDKSHRQPRSAAEPQVSGHPPDWSLRRPLI